MEVIGIDMEASAELKTILEQRDIEIGPVRIFLAGMGCTGPMFNLAIDKATENDISHEFDGLTYIVDKSLADQFGGFDIQLMQEGNYKGLFVKGRNVPEMGGCSTCNGGCH